MNNNNEPSRLPWHDYQPNGQNPATITHLRIGFIQYQLLVGGAATETTTLEVPDKAFYQHARLKQVQIYLPSVLRIGEFSLAHCSQLEQVEFLMKPPREEGESKGKKEGDAPPSQLVSIKTRSFAECKNLKSLIGLEQAHDSLQDVGNSAFFNCMSLVSVAFLASLERLESLGIFAFSCHVVSTIVDFSGATSLTEIQDHAFCDCTSLLLVHLPPNLLKLGQGAFAGCIALEHINLPVTLQTIGVHAFEECSALEYIYLPPRLQHIGIRAFSMCKKLKVIVLPSSLQQIGRECFQKCIKLSQVVLPSSTVSFLKNMPFNESCKSLSSLDLPDLVPCRQWPLILEQFCNDDGIAKASGIQNPKNRNTIVWNFLCQNLPQMFMDDLAWHTNSP